MTLFLAYVLLSPSTDRWHSLYSSLFRVDPTGPPNYVAEVSWYGSEPYQSKKTMIDLIELDGIGGKKLVSSTRFEGDPYVFAVSIHAYQSQEDFEDKKGVYHKHFPTWFLAIKNNGGQHDHTTIMWFDPETMRPKEMLDVLYGDVSRLNRGVVVENTFSQYVNPDDWPKGVTGWGKNLHRAWKYSESASQFKPGKWVKG